MSVSEGAAIILFCGLSEQLKRTSPPVSVKKQNVAKFRNTNAFSAWSLVVSSHTACLPTALIIMDALIEPEDFLDMYIGVCFFLFVVMIAD